MFEIKREKNETIDQFKRRVYKLKYAYNLKWQDIGTILNSELGGNYSCDKYRKEAQKYDIPKDIDSMTLDPELLDIKKELIKLDQERHQINTVIRNQSRNELLCELAEKVSKNIKSTLHLPKKITLNKQTQEGIVAISDWHYGLDTVTYHNTYNPEIAKERIQKLLEKIIEIGTKENIKHITLINLGDMISGKIHFPLQINSRENAVQQTISVAEILGEFLNTLTHYFVIDYYSVTDNHSRVTPNKELALNGENFSEFIDWHLKTRLKNNPNIKINNNKVSKDICTCEVLGHKIVAVHGHQDRQKNITYKLNEYLQEHFDVVLSAHLHHASSDENNGTEFYASGSLMGTDDYAESKRLHSKPSQLMLISTKENVSEVIYKIKI